MSGVGKPVGACDGEKDGLAVGDDDGATTVACFLLFSLRNTKREAAEIP